MHALPTLIVDLTLISLYAGVITLLFKKLKQPLVLGYVVAGILAGPALKIFPSVTDSENIKLWADIGIIFLLFGLGLEFSFKKMMNVGKAGLITATCNVVLMMFIGYTVGMLLGWTSVDSIFLGGMISMSSTTIIIKAFEDLGLKKQRFTELVFGVLVVEDVVGILLLVLLPTIALSQNLDAISLLLSALKLVFFLVVWFVFGIYLIPTFMKKIAPLLTSEMLLIVSVGLCLFMVYLATSAGFSEALGAFIMGSLLAETPLTEKIHEVIKPVKDLFGAVFFVSVGMMVSPMMFVTYFYPIVLLTIVVMVGLTLCALVGFTIAGQNLKTAILGAFSLAQVGEFAFIIASLGVSLGVLGDQVYPIIVAVSVITTFTTPMMIKAAPKAYEKVKQIMPPKWMDALNSLSQTKKETSAEKAAWKELFISYFRNIVLFSFIIVAIVNLSYVFARPFLIPYGRLGRVVLTLFTLMAISPFLRMLLILPKARVYFDLWRADRYNKIPLIALTAARLGIGAFLVVWTIHQLLSTNPVITFFLVVAAIMLVSRSQWVFNQYMRIETQFLMNLNLTETPEENQGEYLTFRPYRVLEQGDFAHKLLQDIRLRDTYTITLVQIVRGQKIIDVPSNKVELLPKDILVVVGAIKDLEAFKKDAGKRGLEELSEADVPALKHHLRRS